MGILDAELSVHLFLLYILISTNYLGDLLSCSFQRLINNNIIYKHLLAFSVFYLTIMISLKDHDNPFSHIFVAIGTYIWFILTTKMSANFVCSLLILIFIVYICTNIISHYQKKEKSEKLKKINNIIKIVGLVIGIIITIVGFVIYYKKKRLKYSKKWNWVTFILSEPKCKLN